MCIDDEPNALTTRKLLLSKAGYAVLTAMTSASAMQVFTSEHVDLVIIDYLLPDRSGGETASEMKRLKPEVPVIVYTGLAERPAGTEDADLVLSKGLAPEEFLAAIANLIAKSRAAGQA